MAIVLSHPCIHQSLIASRGCYVAIYNTENEITRMLNEEGSEAVCFGFSRSKCEMVVCFADKSFKLWTNIDSDALSLAHSGTSARRATAATIDKTGNVLISDKSGDVYKYQRLASGSLGSDGTVILGHVSMLMVMELTTDETKLLTGDRDNKIRSSNYPSTFDIHGFFLGHQECITATTMSMCGQFMLSGSGDGRMGLWDATTCELLSMQNAGWGGDDTNLSSQIITHIVPCLLAGPACDTDISLGSTLYATVCEGGSTVHLVSILSGDLPQPPALQVAMSIKADGVVCSAAYTPSHHVLWLGLLDGRVVAYAIDGARKQATRTDATNTLSASLAKGAPFLLTEQEHRPQSFADFLKAVHDGGTVNYFERKAKRVREAKDKVVPPSQN
eukprot:m.30170 g.30170  ORF g.30170 m.30170 type:complete len:388 (-) comp13832_c0_seq4:2660-3823(-)